MWSPYNRSYNNMSTPLKSHFMEGLLSASSLHSFTYTVRPVIDPLRMRTGHVWLLRYCLYFACTREPVISRETLGTSEKSWNVWMPQAQKQNFQFCVWEISQSQYKDSPPWAQASFMGICSSGVSVVSCETFRFLLLRFKWNSDRIIITQMIREHVGRFCSLPSIAVDAD